MSIFQIQNFGQSQIAEMISERLKRFGHQSAFEQNGFSYFDMKYGKISSPGRDIRTASEAVTIEDLMSEDANWYPEHRTGYVIRPGEKIVHNFGFGNMSDFGLLTVMESVTIADQLRAIAASVDRLKAIWVDPTKTYRVLIGQVCDVCSLQGWTEDKGGQGWSRCGSCDEGVFVDGVTYD